MVKDIILADSDGRELGAILDSNITVDTNGEYEFSVQIARSNWYPELTFSSYVYITETEYGGIIGEVLTDTTLDYYLYHQPFCCALFGLLLYNKLHLSAWLTVVMCMMASLVIPTLILKIFGRGKLGIVLRRIGLLA